MAVTRWEQPEGRRPSLRRQLGLNTPTIRYSGSYNRSQRAGGQWSLKSVESGKYLLGLEGKPNDATRIVAVNQRQLWDIYPEDEDPASFRYVYPVSPPLPPPL